jgi:CBS domain-containing protein
MKIEDLMSKDLHTCSPSETLDCAARVMWECDCGVVPIVDGAAHVVGMITDRDVCMAAYTQNKLLSQIPISSIGMKPVVTVRPDESPEQAESLMQRHQLRRLAVVDRDDRLVGMLSLNDLARRAGRSPRDVKSEAIARTLAAISQPRTAKAASAS